MKRILALCLLTCVSSIAETSESNIGPTDLVSEGKALVRAGKYPAAAQAFRQALAIAEAAKAGEQRLIELHDALASAYAGAGHYAESEHEYRRALALSEKMDGHQSLQHALLAASLAVLPTQIGNRDSLVELLHEAIAVNTQIGSARELAMVRICLAQILIDAKKYVEAESVLLDARAGAGSLKTADRGLLPDILNGLGVLRFNQGRYIESIGLCRESLQLLEGANGDDHPSLVAPLNNLALNYLKLRRFNEAELTLRRANIVCVKTLGEDHRTCGDLLESYAVVLRKLNRKSEAKVVAARSQQIARAARNRNGIGSTISVTALRTRSNNAP